MKLLTLNTHSLFEEDYDQKCEIFADAVAKHLPDVIALQEVNQPKKSPVADIDGSRCLNIGGVAMRSGNHALKIYELLEKRGIKYYLCWAGIKTGYVEFDEGLCFLSKNPIENPQVVKISRTEDFDNWKKRAALVMDSGGICFCNVHMGWWDDAEEPFREQWITLNDLLKSKNNVYIMGDFNSDPRESGTGYELVTDSGWYDTYALAKSKDDGFTVPGKIAGWNDDAPKRIDYIFCRNKADIQSSEVIFDSVNEDVVSDHYGVLVTV